jgi:putative ABC transport system permease protein
LLTESLLLGIAGGIGGLVLAFSGLRFLVAMSPAWLPNLHQVAIDGTVLFFTTGLSILTGIVFGVFPSLESSRCDTAASLKASGRSSTAAFSRQRLRTVLVTGQIALSLILLTGAGLMVNTFIRLLSVDPGFNTQGLVTFRFRLPREPYVKPTGKSWNGFPLQEVSPAAADTFDRIAERLRSVPGVVSATAVSDPPFGHGLPVEFTIEDRPVLSQTDANEMSTAAFFVERAYFGALQVPIVQGRDFNRSDTAGSPYSVIVNQAMARRYWPNENPVGKQLTVVLGKDDQPREIIGVSRDTLTSHFEMTPEPSVYILDGQQPALVRGAYSPRRRLMTFAVRIAGDQGTVLRAVRNAVAEIAPEIPIAEMRSVDEYAGEELQWRRYYAILLGIFAGMATLLAGIGTYGVVAYSVEQRTAEFGIRIALGATRAGIVLMIMRRAAFMVIFGLACGWAGAAALTRFIKSQLWGVTPDDPATFAAVVCLMAGITLAASWIPAQRALRLEVNTALRCE